MANEKVYVGEEGAKELYRKIKALIPGAVTVVDEVSINSMDAVTSHAVAVAIGNLTGFQPVDGTGADNHPNVNTPNTRTIYLVKIPEIVGEDKYKEWIWVIPEQGAGSWECIGSTSIPENAWKQWSEDNGSSGVGDSVYLGKNNTLTRNDTYALGKGNTATITDATDYSNTDVVMLGTSNSATNAANTYQLGRENTVDGNNLEFSAQYPHSMALNLGRNNAITGEGVNIGKDNESTRFGINIGQNSSAANASCSIGSQVRTDDASIAMGNGIPSTNNPTVSDVPSLLVDSKYEPINKFKIKDTYELYDYAAVEHDTNTGTYKWAHVQPISIDFYPNYELNQYLVSWGSVNSTGPYTGYFDENGQWVPSDDPSKDIHQYTHISRVGDSSGSEKVDVNFFTNGESAIKAVKAYLLRSDVLDEDIPMYGTILTKAEYDEFTSKCVYAFKGIQWWSNLFVNPKDLTADAFTSRSHRSDPTLPFVSTYEVYGYKDNDVLIPYNETNKNSDHTFDWYEVNATDVKSQTMPISQVDPKAKLVTAVNRSAIFGMGSVYASGKSLALATNYDNNYQIKYKNTPITYVYRSYGPNNTRYTISQSDGRVTSTGNITISQFAVPNVTDYTNFVTPGCAYAEGGSIVISSGPSTAIGGSVSIGDYANSSGKGYVFGPSSSAVNDAYSFGYAVSSSESSLAFGYSGTYATKQSFALGISGVSSINKSMSIGFEGLYASDNSMAVGFGGSATQRGMIFGYSNSASSDGIAIGRYNTAYSEALTIGTSNTLYYQNIALGFYNQMQDTTDNTIHTALIGVNNTSGLGGYNIGIGESNTSSHEAISIGRANQAYGWSIALGVSNRSAFVAGGHATLIGFNNVSSSTLEQIKKPTYGLVYGMPLTIQQSIMNYAQAFWNKYGDYVEDHIENLSGMKDDITSAYNLMDTYITDSDLDTAYNELMALSTISDLYNTINQSKFNQYLYEISNALNSSTPGYVAGDPITYANNSIIMGTGNTSNHYNSILLGIGNTSLAPAEELEETDDDGFTVAIGFKNTVERNYDMAIGYQSIAKGGENIAITNSEAVGYRNLAYNHSKVNGICNLVLNESTLICKRWDDEPLKIEYNTFNTLNNSKVVYKNTYQSESNTGVTLFGNHFESAICELTASAWGVHSNFILGNGPEPDDSSMSYSPHPDIKIQGGVISKNLIIEPTEWFDIRLSNTASSNAIEQNALLYDKIKIYDAHQFRDNIVALSEFNVQMQSINKGDFHDNVILNSTISGTGAKTNGMNQNIIAGNSRVNLDNTPGTLWNNVVICTSKLTANHDSSIWTNDSEGIVSNFLFGSNAKKVLACVSFGDGGNTDIENAMYSRNFGDNTLYNTNNVFVSGGENSLNAVHDSVVFGTENSFTSTEYAGRKDLRANILHMSEIYVFGAKNSIRHAAGEYFSRIFMSGNGNTIDGNNVHDSAIFGSDNKLCYFGNTLPSQMSVDAVWTLSVSKPTYIEVTEDGYLPGTGTKTCTIFGGIVYYYRDGAAYTVWSGAPSGVTAVEISGTNLYQGIINKTLIDGTYYKATSYPSGNSTVPELNSISKYEYCIKYPDGTTSVAQPANIGISILGNQNRISPNVMWSHVLGTDITISNELKYGISGLFVQGMSQTVSDGSNIICMGAGNVSSGHGSIAIGNQLISDKWQTVIGKYNKALPGPERTIPKHDENKTYNAGDIVYDSLGSKYYKCTSSVPTVGMMQNSLWTEVNPDSEKALFIVGNGYGESDGSGDWNDETKIHRSNAMEVYADGTVKAHDFVSDHELTLDGQNGVTVAEDLVNSKLVVSLDTDTLNIINFFKNRPQNGTYSIQNTNGVLSWVQIGIAQVPVQSQTV